MNFSEDVKHVGNPGDSGKNLTERCQIGVCIQWEQTLFSPRCFYIRSSNAPVNQIDTGHRTEIQRAIMTGKAPEIEKP